ncbi:MAG: type I CRISPR-associated protein Cas7 [Thermoplasmata archaeon]
MTDEKEDSIKKNYNAIVVVNAKNANFNAGFDGLPRRLPDGRIFATDKALKYCIRQYLAEKGEKIFVERTREFFVNENSNSGKSSPPEENKDIKLRYLTLEENFKKKTMLNEMPKNEKLIVEKLKEFIDVRLFGVVFAVSSNISLTGPCQISYGINQYADSSIYTIDILSPYRNPSEKSEEQQQTTKGEQSRADDVYYVYDVSLNMNSARKQGINITDEDINKLKDALKYSVNNITSCTKFGCEIVSMVWFSNKDNKVFNNLNSLVKIKKENDKVVVDYTDVFNIIKDDIDSPVEEFKNKVEHRGIPTSK